MMYTQDQHLHSLERKETMTSAGLRIVESAEKRIQGVNRSPAVSETSTPQNHPSQTHELFHPRRWLPSQDVGGSEDLEAPRTASGDLLDGCTTCR